MLVAGPFLEADGSRRPPAMFKAYVAALPVALGILAPAAGLAYLIWQNEASLGVATLGVYLVELISQLVFREPFSQTE